MNSNVSRLTPFSARRAGDNPTAPVAARLLDLHEAGAYIGVSYWTVRDLVQAGKLPSVKLPNARRKGESVRRVLVDVRDLDRLIDDSKEVA